MPRLFDTGTKWRIGRFIDRRYLLNEEHKLTCDICKTKFNYCFFIANEHWRKVVGEDNFNRNVGHVCAHCVLQRLGGLEWLIVWNETRGGRMIARQWDIQADSNWWLSLGLHFDHADPSLTLHLPGLIICFGRCKQPGFRYSVRRRKERAACRYERER